MELNRAQQSGLLRMAMTNEERFIASCENAGEADVRQRLNAGRYGGSKELWASNWLEQVDGAKSEATKSEEKSSRLRVAAKTNHNFRFAALALVLVMLLASLALVFMSR